MLMTGRIGLLLSWVVEQAAEARPVSAMEMNPTR